MSDFDLIAGFEDVWRPVARPRQVSAPGLLKSPSSEGASRRLLRLSGRAPEVMVKITGRTHSEAHLAAHLCYIARQGDLPLEGRDGERVRQRADLRDLAAAWAEENVARRRDSPLSLSLVLSMPPGTPAIGLRDAGRAFAAEVFGEQFEYVFALHTDAEHPHMHLAVRMLGRDGKRLNPRKGDLELWRQTFARLLRDRGISAEATPRRARGVVLKAERIEVRKLRQRHEAGEGAAPRVLESARAQAQTSEPSTKEMPWLKPILRRQSRIRRAYLAQADRLEEKGLIAAAAEVRAFVAAMPAPATRQLSLAREQRTRSAADDAARQLGAAPAARGPPERG